MCTCFKAARNHVACIALYKGPGFASIRAPRALNCTLLTVACGFMAGAKRSVNLKTHVHCGELIAPPSWGVMCGVKERLKAIA